MKSLFITLALILPFVYGISQPLTGPQIDQLAEKTLKTFEVPGIAVAVIKDGKVVHSKGYGVRSLNTKEPVNENTLFGIASNTKAFTATALGILVDEGKLNWDDKVRDYIPEFKLYNPYVTEEFTIRDLLTHRSGMGLGAGDLMMFPDSADFTVKDLIYNLRYLKQVSGFRTRYDYDNNLYVVAGEVVSRVSGTGWDEFVEKRIMNPLAMNHSAASFARLKDRSNVIDGHAPVEGKVQVIRRHDSKIDQPAGSIYSCISDLSNWVLMHLNGGKYEKDQKARLVSEEVHQELWTPQTIIPVRNPGSYNTHFGAYGLGFFLADVKGYKQVSHTGGLEGMVTQITMIPELNLGIIVLTNQQEGGAFRAITDQIKDGYLGITGSDPLAQYAEARKKSLEEAAGVTEKVWKEINAVRNQPVANLTPFTGTYRDSWLGEVIISDKEGKMWFTSVRSPKLKGEMLPYKGNTFVVKWLDRSMDADAFASFTLDTEGKSSGFTMKAISPLTDFSYDFQDLEFRRVK